MQRFFQNTTSFNYNHSPKSQISKDLTQKLLFVGNDESVKKQMYSTLNLQCGEEYSSNYLYIFINKMLSKNKELLEIYDFPSNRYLHAYTSIYLDILSGLQNQHLNFKQKKQDMTFLESEFIETKITHKINFKGITCILLFISSSTTLKEIQQWLTLLKNHVASSNKRYFRIFFATNAKSYNERQEVIAKLSNFYQQSVISNILFFCLDQNCLDNFFANLQNFKSLNQENIQRINGFGFKIEDFKIKLDFIENISKIFTSIYSTTLYILRIIHKKVIKKSSQSIL